MIVKKIVLQGLPIWEPLCYNNTNYKRSKKGMIFYTEKQKIMGDMTSGISILLGSAVVSTIITTRRDTWSSE